MSEAKLQGKQHGKIVLLHPQPPGIWQIINACQRPVGGSDLFVCSIPVHQGDLKLIKIYLSPEDSMVFNVVTCCLFWSNPPKKRFMPLSIELYRRPLYFFGSELVSKLAHFWQGCL